MQLAKQNIQRLIYLIQNLSLLHRLKIREEKGKDNAENDKNLNYFEKLMRSIINHVNKHAFCRREIDTCLAALLRASGEESVRIVSKMPPLSLPN